MHVETWIEDLFRAIDNKDTQKFVGYLTDDASFRYAGQPTVSGRTAVSDYVATFFTTVNQLKHTKLQSWRATNADLCFVAGEVTYTLHEGRVVTLPFLNYFAMQGDRIEDYRVYTDPTPMITAG